MILKEFIVFFTSFVLINGQTGILSGRSDAVMKLISVAGYTSEAHRVMTDDGYLLRLHRVLPKVQKDKKGPILMIHGLFGTSADWVLTGRDVALAYHLSNDGFDVWMGNVRGSKFSMKHRSLDPLSREFWQFSFHEIGFHDLPAMINYILGVTGKPTLYYIGHNQGTTALLVLLSTRPEYNAKISQSHMLAPIAFMDYPHPLVALGIDEQLKKSQSRTFNFVSLVDFTNLIVNTYCADRSFQSLNFCTDLWFMLFGRNLNQTEISSSVLMEIPNFISPTASIKQWNHFLQLGKSGKFQMYDGRSDSMFASNSMPSEYNLANVKAPMMFYHAAEDLVVSRLVGFAKSHEIEKLFEKFSPQDVERLKQILPAVIRDYRVIPNWNHMDFVLSKNARIVLYDSILNSLNSDNFDILGFVKSIFG